MASHFNEHGEGKWFQLINFHHCALTEMFAFLITLPQHPGEGSAISGLSLCARPSARYMHTPISSSRELIFTLAPIEFSVSL